MIIRTVIRLLASSYLVAVLAGCALSQPALSSARADAAHTADAILAGTVDVLCHAITVGAWVREYGRDAARARAWRVLCAAPIDELPAAEDER